MPLPSPIIQITPAENGKKYQNVRNFSTSICQALETEDMVIQTMPDVSPPKWHLAHTSWFFETFLLQPYCKNYRTFHPEFNFLFNSYYKGIGSHFPRKHRGLLSRPSVQEILNYRNHVDEWMQKLLSTPLEDTQQHRLILGLNHEQQHQELLFTDIKHILGNNPLHPLYHQASLSEPKSIPPLRWIQFSGGLHKIGFSGTDFSFDNERPEHSYFLNPYRLASRLITNGEFLEFMGDHGYENPLLWLSEGWDWVERNGRKAPLYWEQRDSEWWNQTLHGLCPVRSEEPVGHVNYFEAQAYAQWAGKRLPTEQEWERAAREQAISGNFVESQHLHPKPAASTQSGQIQQLFGDLWEWTRSPYEPYPGFQADTGAIGEYNGKFMCNQYVLRGGSCFSSQNHLRSTYRNFFPANAQWQASGFRLAEDS